MRISNLNWMDVEARLKQDDRAIIPLGSTEQHAYLSLATDSILAERVAVEAAEPLGVVVFPVLCYGVTPRFLAYPGTISLGLQTYLSMIRDLLESLEGQGFKRILFVNGHGGNTNAKNACVEFLQTHTSIRIKWHDWWNAPLTWEYVQGIEPGSSHASWMENFPWTRLSHAMMPDKSKEAVFLSSSQQMGPDSFRKLAGDGNFGGSYQRPDSEMITLWQIAVTETRSILEEDWN